MNRLFASLFLVAGAVASAQPGTAEAPAGAPRRVQVFNAHEAGATTGPAFSWTVSDVGFEALNVKGSPFSGDFVTENSQTLADGNRIRTTNTTSYARDGEGRTRREVSFEAIGPWAANGPRKTVFIHDPVSGIDWVLDPQEKTARKMVLNKMMPKIAKAPAGEPGKASQTMVFERRLDTREETDVMVTDARLAAPVMERTPLPPGLVLQGPEGAVVGQRVEMVQGVVGTAAIASTAAPANFKNDSLGKRIIEGVEAEGTRTTVTIPAGQIGNDRPIETVSERWFSQELKTLVMSTRSDPRSGESVYKLTNLRRGEPSPMLFEPPPDYKVVEDGPFGGAIRMKVERK